MNRIVLNVETLDEIRMDCGKHALYPIINHMGDDIDYFLLNSFHTYVVSEDKVLTLQEVECDFYKELGYVFEKKNDNIDFIDYVKIKLENNQPLYIMCDLFALPRFKSPDKNGHGFHAVCVYGFDDEEQKFFIIDHEYHDSFLYIKQEISYDDLRNASISCEKHLNYASIRTIKKDMTSRDMKNTPIETFKNNFIQYEDLMKKGFDNILQYWGILKQKFVNDNPENVKNFISLSHSHIGNIMNQKIYEQAIIKKYFPTEQFIAQAENRTFCINYIYAVMAKYMMKPKENAALYNSLAGKFELFYQQEVNIHDNFIRKFSVEE